jgi:hypothetical protein
MPTSSAGAIGWRTVLAGGHCRTNGIAAVARRVYRIRLGPEPERRQAAALCVDAGVVGHSAGFEGTR